MGTSTVASLTAVISANNTKFKKGIKQSNSVLGNFKKSVGTLGPAIVAAFGVRAIVNFAKASTKAYNVQAQAENQLLVALKGRKSAQQELIAQAQELQKITLFGDEETIRAQALIAAFVKEEDQIKTIIPLVQDLAAAKGMDLAGAADLVSKTLGSSTNALSRYGIEVEGNVGSTERLTSLANGLTSAFGGQAEAAAKVGTGPLQQLDNQLGDLKETIGGLVTEILVKVVPTLKLMADGLQRVFDGAEKIRKQVWDDSTKNAVIEDAKEVKTLANRYLELGVSQNEQQAEQKAVNDLILQYIKALAMAEGFDKKKAEMLKVQIAELRNYGKVSEEFTTQIVDETEIKRGSINDLKEQIDTLKKSRDNASISEIGQLNYEIKLLEAKTKALGEITKYEGPDLSLIGVSLQNSGISDFSAEVDSEVENMISSLLKIEPALEDVERVSVKKGASISDTLTRTFTQIGSSFAESLGRVAAGTKTLQDTLNELSAMIVSALGDIAIAAGIKLGVATPQGLGLIVGGLALKGIGAFASSNKDNGDKIRTFEPRGSGSDSQELYIRGNNLVTAYNQTSELNNRLY